MASILLGLPTLFMIVIHMAAMSRYLVVGTSLSPKGLALIVPAMIAIGILVRRALRDDPPNR